MVTSERAKLSLGVLAVAAVLGALCWRLTIGVNLSDEAYYAAFVDDWIKGDIASSTFLVLHQTAALLVYPAALAYYHLTGSTDGIFLFLRCLFLVGQCVAAGVLFAFLRRLTGNYCALALALASVSFLPITLPAPSYDTIGLQGLIVALASAGSAFLAASARERLWWQLLSAFAWGVVVIAYPPLFAAIPVLCALMALFLRARPGTWCYILLVCAAAAIAVAIGIEVFSWKKLHDSFIYLAAFNGSDNFRRKLNFALGLFALHSNRKMALMFIPAIMLGLWRPFLAHRVTAFWLALFFLILEIFFRRFSGLFLFPEHDMVTLAALTGLGLLADLRSEDAGRRLVAVLYATSMAAGTIFVAASTIGVINFCIGAFPAAVLSVAAAGVQPGARRVFNLLAGSLLWLLLFVPAVTMYYGDARIPLPREQVTWGAVKGLWVRTDEFIVINAMRDVVLPLMHPRDTILVLGSSPGLIMQTPARTKAYSIYAMNYPYATPKVLAMTHAFYETPSNRPDIVVIYHDNHFLNPFGDDFTRWYAFVTSRNYPGGLFEVFRKRVTPLP